MLLSPSDKTIKPPIDGEVIPPGPTLVVKPRPFSNEGRFFGCVPYGQTIEDMVREHIPDEVLRSCAVVTIQGEKIDREWWPRVRPKPGALVNVAVIPQKGGGGGGKSPFRMILTLAIMVASMAFGGALGGFILGPELAGTTLFTIGSWAPTLGSLVGGAIISGVGQLVSMAIAPPSKSGRVSDLSGVQSSVAQPPESPTLSITGARNRSNPYGIIPRVYGRHKVFPLYAAQPFQATEGEDQYLYLLFDFGYGPLELSDLRIGTNPIAQFEGIDIEIREGYATDEAITIYHNERQQDDYNIRVMAASPQSVETRQNCDEASIDIAFPRLVRYDSSGNRQTTTVDMGIEYRLAGSSDPYTSISVQNGASVSTVSQLTKTNGTRWISYSTANEVAGPVEVTLSVPASYAGTTIYGMRFAIYTKAQGQADWVKQHEDASLVLAGTSNKVTVNPPTGKVANIKIESLELAKSAGSWDGTNSVSNNSVPSVAFSYTEPSQSTSFSASSSNTVRRSLRVKFPSRNKWEIKVTRSTADNSTDTQLFNESYIAAVRTITYNNPTNYAEPHCLVAMRIKATNQLSGVIDEFNAIAHSILPVWNGSAWVNQKTRNPAWAFVDILKGTANAKPVTDARLDLASIVDWANACDAPAPQSSLPGAVTSDQAEPYWTCDVVIDYASTVFECLRDVTSTGRAALAMPNGKFGVVRDVAQNTPIQIFTPRNSWGFRGLKTFVDMPHAFKTKFVDPESNWAARELTVYDDGQSEETATKFEELELYGCTRPTQAWREARFHIASVRLRPESFELTTDIENLIATRGDLVEVAHDVPVVGGSFARVATITVDAGNVTAFTTDELVTMEGNVPYIARTRLSSGVASSISLVYVGGESDSFTLTTPTAEASAMAVGDLIVIGPSDSATGEYLVKEVKPGPDLSAVLILIDAAPAVHAADQSAIPAYVPISSAITDATPPAALTDVTISAENTAASRRYTYAARLNWTSPVFCYAYEVYVQDPGEPGYRLLETTKSQTALYSGLTKGQTYNFKVLGVTSAGRKIALGDANEFSFLVEGLVPPDNESFDVNIVGSEAHLFWDVSADVVNGWRIKYHPTVDTNLTWGEMQDLVRWVSYPTNHLTVPARSGTYAIKAVSYDETEAAGFLLSTVTDLPNDLNYVAAISEAPAWAGTPSSVGVGDGTTFPADALHLAGIDTVADWTLMSEVPIISVGQSGFVSQGNYIADAIVDLGAVFTSRITTSVAAYGVDPFDLVSLWTSVSSRTTIAGVSSSAWSVAAQISTTQDDPNGTPTWSAWQAVVVGDYLARASRFRLVLNSTDSGVTPIVTAFDISIDMPDRVVRQNDLVSSASGDSINFSPAFYSACAPTVVVTASNMATGDYYAVTNKDSTGFDIRFFNSAGTGISRIYDYAAVGYGVAN